MKVLSIFGFFGIILKPGTSEHRMDVRGDLHEVESLRSPFFSLVFMSESVFGCERLKIIAVFTSL